MAYRYSGVLLYRNFSSYLATTAFHDVFSLYGRPRAYSWDPRDDASMMYAYPVGPARDVSFRSPCSVSAHLLTTVQSLFLERDSAETLDPRNDRTSVIRTHLLNILSLRIQALSSQSVTAKLSNSNGSSTLPPLPSTEEPATGMPQNGSASLPRFPSVGPASSGPEATRRALTPIVEGSTSEKDPNRPPVNGATVASSD